MFLDACLKVDQLTLVKGKFVQNVGNFRSKLRLESLEGRRFSGLDIFDFLMLRREKSILRRVMCVFSLDGWYRIRGDAVWLHLKLDNLIIRSAMEYFFLILTLIISTNL